MGGPAWARLNFTCLFSFQTRSSSRHGSASLHSCKSVSARLKKNNAHFSFASFTPNSPSPHFLNNLYFSQTTKTWEGLILPPWTRIAAASYSQDRWFNPRAGFEGTHQLCFCLHVFHFISVSRYFCWQGRYGEGFFFDQERSQLRSIAETSFSRWLLLHTHIS